MRDGRGGFRAVLANARIPGLYRAEVRINGEDRQLGRIERSQTVTASLPFGEADRATSALTLRTSPGNRAIELTVRPADRRGNLLGPGFAGQIALEVSNRKIDRGPEDLGDGRYRFVLSHPGRAGSFAHRGGTRTPAVPWYDEATSEQAWKVIRRARPAPQGLPASAAALSKNCKRRPASRTALAFMSRSVRGWRLHGQNVAGYSMSSSAATVFLRMWSRI